MNKEIIMRRIEKDVRIMELILQYFLPSIKKVFSSDLGENWKIVAVSSFEYKIIQIIQII